MIGNRLEFSVSMVVVYTCVFMLRYMQESAIGYGVADDFTKEETV